MQPGTDSSFGDGPPLQRRTTRYCVRWSRALATNAALLCSFVFPIVAASSARASFFVRYVVSVPQPGADVLRVRWELAGANEVTTLELVDREHSLRNIAATGEIRPTDGGWLWAPNGPYAHLAYEVAVNRLRGQQARYDSYSHPQWVVTRGRLLFPLTRIVYRKPATPSSTDGPTQDALLYFQLPAGWSAATPYPRATQAHAFRLSKPRGIPLPRGWIALGRFAREEREVAGVHFEFARMPGSGLDAESLFSFLDATFPLLLNLFPERRDRSLNRVLVVSAPDPMWHGGISGFRSLFLHGQRPLRDVDRTSPILHELFHVFQPFRPATDADWIVEGLAEFYSLELQRRAGILDHKAYNQALRSFRRYGSWGVDLRQQRDNAATNNSAPLVFHALDQELLRITGGNQGLDQVVALLAREDGRVGSLRFASLAAQVAGRPLDAFFRKHVYHGQPPKVASDGAATVR